MGRPEPRTWKDMPRLLTPVPDLATIGILDDDDYLPDWQKAEWLFCYATRHERRVTPSPQLGATWPGSI